MYGEPYGMPTPDDIVFISWFLFPLKRYAVGDRGEGVICFLVSKQQIEKQINRIAGRIDGEIAVWYEDTLIYGEAQEGASLTRVSGDGKLKTVCWQG